MKQITIISGKGGTGKTTIASNFIKLASNHIAVDCDVDASNLHIMFEPELRKKEEFIGGAVARVTGDCINCGKCEEACRFDAISGSKTDIKIDLIRCEGCGVCEYVCPVSAIELESDCQGNYFVSDIGYCTLVHARLKPGAENSGLLITRIRNLAEDLAINNGNDLILIDGAPGIGCPVISSLAGVDYALIITEPTVSGISDFKRVYEVAKFLDIKAFVCVNKYDLNVENTEKIEDFCLKNDIRLAGRIPYDDRVPLYLSNRKFITEDAESGAGREIINLWKTLSPYLKTS
ncbi:MAG: ATP-binding protein [Actinobacteria bacterium]|nr:ATP-binding protein [Actinomycetota bacterium]